MSEDFDINAMTEDFIKMCCNNDPETINYYYDEEPKVVTKSYNKYNHLTSRTDSKQKSITYRFGPTK